VLSCGNKGSETLAEVDSQRITAEDFMLKAKLYGLSVRNEKEAERFLNLIINDLVLLQLAKREKINVERIELENEIGKFIPGYDRDEIRKSLLQQGMKYSSWEQDIKDKIIRKKVIEQSLKNRIKIDETDLRDFYWSNILEFRVVRKVRARQIVLDSEEKAREVVMLAREGRDFSELARKYSVSSEAEDGGDLGYFAPNDMPNFISSVVFKMKKGDISTIIKSSYGWHIFKVEDVTEARTLSFDEVKDEVYDKCFESKKDEYFGVWMEELRKKSKIRIYEERLKNIIQEEKNEKSVFFGCFDHDVCRSLAG
ncbi:MAG TPA: peptidylprolyl isomerase, partial [Candidatus Goldiibacteriota bacterium]|nr:peptidylprolyl isomerase [Candidatus Goldiibacteriota bacterium]